MQKGNASILFEKPPAVGCWGCIAGKKEAEGPLGGGLHTGRLCGAISGACAALGIALIQEDAHKTPALKPACSELVEAFVKEFGSDQCSEICKTYKKPDVRCLTVVEWTAETLQKKLTTLGGNKQ